MTQANRWIREEIRHLSAYSVQDAKGLIKLDAMENPYTWPETLRVEWAEQLQNTHVNRYPDPHATELGEQLRAAMAIPPDMAVLLGNGSDEIIQIIAMTLGSGHTILSVEPSFVMYRMVATFCGLEYVGVPLKPEDFSLDMPAMLQAIEQRQPAVIFLSYPNNPTGNLFNAEEIQILIEAAPGLVVVDEAYAPFTQASFMSQLGQYDNLVVMRTVSKMGLAGLRLGLLAGREAWLKEFDKVRLPYNVNTLTQVSTRFALKHKAIFDQQTQAICQERERLLSLFNQLFGFKAFPSQTNFILLRTPDGEAEKYFNGLKDHGILIKKLCGSHPILRNCLRPTVGTPEENAAMLQALLAI